MARAGARDQGPFGASLHEFGRLERRKKEEEPQR
jgi:hypothetical protein